MRTRLAKRLKDVIEAKATDERPRDSIVEELAEAAGVQTSALEAIINCTVKASDEQLQEFSKTLEVKVEDLLEASGAPDPDPAAGPLTIQLADPAPQRKESDPEPEPESDRKVIALSEVKSAVAEVRKAERERAKDIREACRLAGLSAETQFVDKLVESDLSVEEARRTILEERFKRDQATDTIGHISMGVAESDKIAVALESALLHRYNPVKYQLEGGAGEFRGMTLLDMGRWCASRAGLRTQGVSRLEVAKLALHSTSDFPKILAAVANKTLRDAYDESPRTWAPLSREVTATDFKAIHRVQLGEAPTLEKLNEHGEYRRGSIAEGEETYAVSSYGKIIGITRKVIVNDDLNAFTRIPMLFGRSAARLESDLVWGVITANALMGDGIALFDAAHNNVAAAPSAIATASIDEGWSAIAKQKGLDNQAHLNLMGRHLVVPIALRATALKNVGELARQRILATKSADVPVFADDLDVIAEPRLDDDSATRWYLAADPNQVDMIEHAYLEGERGVQIETREGFDVDGVEVRARLDFGTGVIDFRGFFKNDGV